MKKVLLICVLITIASNACKVRKAIHTTTKSVDSTTVQHTQANVHTVAKDTSSFSKLSNFFNISKNTDLSIDKIKETEEYTPPRALVFDMDSIHAVGDTAKVTSQDGTQLNLFTDKKTGKHLASIQEPGAKKKTLEMQGFKLKASTNIDSGNVAATHTKAASVNIDSTGKGDVQTHVQAKQKDKDKNVQRSTDMLKLVLWVAGVVAVIVLVVWLYKKYKSKISI